MPLVLTIAPGASFYIAEKRDASEKREYLTRASFFSESRFTLERIASEQKVYLVRDSDGVVFEVTVFENTEIDPDVVVQLGDRMTTKVARIQIEAPQRKLILSQENYNKISHTAQ